MVTRFPLQQFFKESQKTKDNVKDVCFFGRTRWKIENEGMNALNTKGDHVEHNFGHGQQYLA